MLNRILSRPDNTKTITFFYFFLLVYTLAALIWWGILLSHQNNRIMELEQQVLLLKKEEPVSSSQYSLEQKRINEEKRLRTLQYMGEGGTFLFIILLSAGFVYSAMRRQLGFSRQQQNFMAAVTHELKSPIAIIQLNLETLQKRTLTDEQKKKLFDNNLSEINRLNGLCNNMLLASRFDSHQYRMIKEKVNLSELLQELAKESSLRMHQHTLQSDIPDGVEVMGDKFMLQIAVNNLLVNAAKYSPAQSIIKMNLQPFEKMIRLQVADEGGGIPPEEKAKIFSRFYRVGNENTRKTKGTGLGLFLTKKIIEQHKGNITALDNHPKGSIFEITLPGLQE